MTSPASVVGPLQPSLRDFAGCPIPPDFLGGRVPHISLVFREMWDSANPSSGLFLLQSNLNRNNRLQICHPDRSAAQWRDLRLSAQKLNG
jgi:hypothetical protein